MSNIFISCDEANILNTRDQYNDLSHKEKFKYKLHSHSCFCCKNFEKKSRVLSKTLNNTSWVKLSDSEKNSIKDKLKEVMKK